MLYLGDFAAGATVHVPWSTNDNQGAAITRSVNGSIRIYKNNSTTQRTSSNGITDSEDFDDPVTGVHLITIDLSDNTDAGFYAAGNNYHVMLQGATINSQTVNRWLATFSIANRVSASPGVRQNVAFSNFLFYMTDSTNHSALTGLTDASFTKQESIDGASFTALSGTVSEIGVGWYKIDLTAAELNGNNVALRFAATGADTTNLSVITSD